MGINIVWCSSCDDVLPCCKIHDDVEKEDAFQGLCAMVNSNFPLFVIFPALYNSRLLKVVSLCKYIL
jgi:hypothetical protein